jgi:hypothetical protein
MKKFILLIAFIIAAVSLSAQSSGPKGRDVGFGIQLGDPTAITAKFWTGNTNAFQVSLGNSFFGALSIGGDYLWHFDVFNTRQQLYLYAGPGVILGFGDGNDYIYDRDDDRGRFYVRDDDDFGLAGKGLVGITWFPKIHLLNFILKLAL